MTNQKKRVLLFAYDFPHKKTQDFIVQLTTEGYHIACVLAAPWEKLPIQASSIELPKFENLIHPKILCEQFGIPYMVTSHNSKKAEELLKSHQVDYAIISGARILSSVIRKAIPQGIINVHPGLLPEMRGLDTLLWSIEEDIPLGITVHYLGEKIDGGVGIYKEQVPVKAGDTLTDLSRRLIEIQPRMLLKALRLLETGKANLFPLDSESGRYHKKMTPEQEKKALEKYPAWRKKYAKRHNV